MKNVFVTLTEARWVQGKGASNPGSRVSINMSRCQEMWPNNDGSTKLVMNIPDCTVMVMESIEVILQKLDDVNGEADPERPSEQREPSMIPIVKVRAVMNELVEARTAFRETLRGRGDLIGASEETGKLFILQYMLDLPVFQGGSKNG